MLRKILLVGLLSLALTPLSYAGTLTEDCTNLVLDYAYYKDRPDPENYAGIFAEDASLSVGGETWVGRDTIQQVLIDSVDGPKYRHLMSTIRIFPVDENHATGVSYVTVYNAPQGQRTVEGFAAVGEYHDEFVRTADGWKIQKRQFVPEFFYQDKED